MSLAHLTRGHIHYVELYIWHYLGTTKNNIVSQQLVLPLFILHEMSLDAA
jgi:hypothetical protein